MQSLPADHNDVKYEALPASESDSSSQTFPRSWRSFLQLGALFTIAMLVAFYAGRHSLPTTREGLLCEFTSLRQRNRNADLFEPVPPGSIAKVWHHNRTFSQTPTPESEAAWESIIPGMQSPIS